MRLGDALWSMYPAPARILRLLGLIEVTRERADATKFQPDFTLRALHPERVPQQLSDPVQVFKDGMITADRQTQ